MSQPIGPRRNPSVAPRIGSRSRFWEKKAPTAAPASMNQIATRNHSIGQLMVTRRSKRSSNVVRESAADEVNPQRVRPAVVGS